jgi:hypothetical protein
MRRRLAGNKTIRFGASKLTFLEPSLYVVIKELENGPKPFPLSNGFSPSTAYRALGLFNPSETSDAYLILSNDHDEIWFICNRHLRTYGIFTEATVLRLNLSHSDLGKT